MERIKGQIEAQIQEIVFFGSLIASFSFFLSGILHLALSPESLGFILGSFGAATVSALFSVFGYGYFYLAVVALHMGYVTNYHVFNFKDLKREYPVLFYSVFAHFLIITLFSTLLTVFQVYMEIPAGGSLTHGAGGFMGSIFGGHLYMAMGIYGSLILLVAFKIITAVVAGFFELHDVLVAMKSTSKTTAHLSIKGAKHMNHALLNGAQFILKGNEFSEATAASARMVTRSMNKANHIFTEHFHIYRDEEPVVEPKAEKKEKKETIKPAVKKATSAMALRSEKLMASLKELKKMTAMKKAAAPVKATAPVKVAAPAVKAAAPVAKAAEKAVQKAVEKKVSKKKTTTVVKAKAKKKL